MSMLAASNSSTTNDNFASNKNKQKVATISFDTSLSDSQSSSSSAAQWWQIEPITKVSLSRNSITRIPDQIIEDCYETLIHLDVSYNALSCLPDRLHYCSQLKYLNVSQNKVRDMVRIPRSVVVFNVSNNELQHFPENLFHSDDNSNKEESKIKLVEFRASKNKLKSLPQSCFQHLTLLQVLELKGNFHTLYSSHTSVSSIRSSIPL